MPCDGKKVNITRFVKTTFLKKYGAHIMKSFTSCERRSDWDKFKNGNTKDHESILITENCNSHDIARVTPHNTPSCLHCNPNASQAKHSTLLLQNGSHLRRACVGSSPKLQRPKLRSDAINWRVSRKNSQLTHSIHFILVLSQQCLSELFQQSCALSTWLLINETR